MYTFTTSGTAETEVICCTICNMTEILAASRCVEMRDQREYKVDVREAIYSCMRSNRCRLIARLEQLSAQIRRLNQRKVLALLCLPLPATGWPGFDRHGPGEEANNLGLKDEPQKALDRNEPARCVCKVGREFESLRASSPDGGDRRPGGT